jgi:hypothetical protein
MGALGMRKGERKRGESESGDKRNERLNLVKQKSKRVDCAINCIGLVAVFCNPKRLLYG